MADIQWGSVADWVSGIGSLVASLGVEFITSDDGLFDLAGFAYIPDSNPPVKNKNSYKQISDSWWQWKETF